MIKTHWLMLDTLRARRCRWSRCKMMVERDEFLIEIRFDSMQFIEKRRTDFLNQTTNFGTTNNSLTSASSWIHWDSSLTTMSNTQNKEIGTKADTHFSYLRPCLCFNNYERRELVEWCMQISIYRPGQDEGTKRTYVRTINRATLIACMTQPIK